MNNEILNIYTIKSLKALIPKILNGKTGENGAIVQEIVEVLESDQDIECAYHQFLEDMNAQQL